LRFCIADARQQTDIYFGQSPFGQVRSNAISSCDNLGGFKFTEAKLPWMKPMKTIGLEDLNFSTLQMPGNVVSHTVHHHDFDGLIPFKGNTPKVLNQGTLTSLNSSLNFKEKTCSCCSIFNFKFLTMCFYLMI
jgi:hypothetical protein